jgi:ankyrin repeat protein
MSKTRMLQAIKDLDIAAVKALLDEKPSLLTAQDPGGRNLLHIACSVPCADLRVPESLSAKMVNLLLDRGLDVESTMPDKDHCTALFFAVARGRNHTLVRLLLKRGATPARAPGHGLYAAAWWDDVESLRLLIRAGAKVDIVVGVTPFFAAWTWRKFDAATFLVEKGADVDFQDPRKRRTALHYGIEKEFEPARLRWLVAQGASPDIPDRDGVTARERAARKRDKKWLDALGAF